MSIREYVSDNPAINPPARNAEQKEIMELLLLLLGKAVKATEKTHKREEILFLILLIEHTASSYYKLAELTHDRA